MQLQLGALSVFQGWSRCHDWAGTEFDFLDLNNILYIFYKTSYCSFFSSFFPVENLFSSCFVYPPAPPPPEQFSYLEFRIRYTLKHLNRSTLDKFNSYIPSWFLLPLVLFCCCFRDFLSFFLSHINGWDKGSSHSLLFPLTSISVYVSEGKCFHGTKERYSIFNTFTYVLETLWGIWDIYPLQQQLEATWDIIRCLKWSWIFKSGQLNPETRSSCCKIRDCCDTKRCHNLLSSTPCIQRWLSHQTWVLWCFIGEW